MALDELFEEILKHIRLIYPEFNKASDDELKDLFEIAFSEVCQTGYTKHNYIKALTLYTLHLKKDIENRSGNCDIDYTQDTKSERINDIAVNYSDKDKINGIKPLNNYHYLYLLVPKCKIKSSLMYPISSGGCELGMQGAWSGTDRVPYKRNTRDRDL